ncbi:MFS transporter [Bradyrhizobium sp. CCBAU 45384]|uniref:MFS transporter n=1 Tax=Bradyrhizobium sp. CCBAU 45384 TaxID=858428 RepID=UPI0023060CF7|nr:MFS transporter [Bradyrhizobium sp. CCBAU 45384]
MSSSRSTLSAYLLGLASWFAPLGVQMVLFPWLVAVVLRMDAFSVGIAQAALMAPGLLFLPLGGLVADRGNPRRLLALYHIIYALPPLALAWMSWKTELSYPLLIGYGVTMGAISAFALPTRDALLPSIVPRAKLPSAVAYVTAMQFVGQLLGIACGSQADRFGAPPLLLANSIVLLLGCVALSWISDPPRDSNPKKGSFWRGVTEGVSEAARSEQIWPVLLLNFGIGLFYVGPFMAVIPLAVRDAYAGSSAELAYTSFAFWAGTIIASMGMASVARRLDLRGRVIVIAVGVGTLVLTGLSTLPPFPVFVALNFLWGIGAGITLTQARTIVQLMAPPSHRARLMSLFQLGMGGGGPIGSLIAGTVCAVWGLSIAMLLPALSMMLLVLLLLVHSQIWTMLTKEPMKEGA